MPPADPDLPPVPDPAYVSRLIAALRALKDPPSPREALKTSMQSQRREHFNLLADIIVICATALLFILLTMIVWLA